MSKSFEEIYNKSEENYQLVGDEDDFVIWWEAFIEYRRQELIKSIVSKKKVKFENLEQIREHLLSGGGVCDGSIYYSEYGWSCGDGCCSDYRGERGPVSREAYIEEVLEQLRAWNQGTGYRNCQGYSE